MSVLDPILPPYDLAEWQTKPLPERLKMVCQSWALQGYGTPWPIYVVYILKIAFYIGVWTFFCSFSTDLGGATSVGAWWSKPEAFQKAILWSMLFEGVGLGCGSGPLTGRYAPPIGGILHWLRPGTIKMPIFEGLPILGGSTRTFVDVALYGTHLMLLVRALIAPQLSLELLVPIVIVLPVLGIADKTIFLASRAEHYYSALVCMLFAADWIAGTKFVWIGVWMWAATSKLNHHFPSVVAVMQSNSPWTNYEWVRKKLYRNYPEDLRPSRAAAFMAHAGTVVEFSFPVVLLLSDGGTTTVIALVVMVLFHSFITGSIPMGVPIEWNFLMVYGAFFLFGAHADVNAFQIGSPVLVAYLVCAMFLMQVVGNFFPSRVSFLCSMRYYAGNWAYSVWLFRGDADKKVDDNVVKVSGFPREQLGDFYDDPDVVTAVLSKVVGFRLMHVHGRALHDLWHRAVDNLDDYEYYDGEIIAGVVLGWNFGEGHLHGMQLLRALQDKCDFEEGELRCIMVESQPLFSGKHAWTIADAKTGVMETGTADVADLLSRQPWPTGELASKYE